MTDTTLTVHVPVPGREARRPQGGASAAGRANSPADRQHPVLKALARAFRWKRMLESGQFATIAELARHEGSAKSSMTRVLRLALLAPDVVEAILDGTQGPEVTLARLLEPFPVEWQRQMHAFRAD